jgi:hypothetical protein
VKRKERRAHRFRPCPTGAGPQRNDEKSQTGEKSTKHEKNATGSEASTQIKRRYDGRRAYADKRDGKQRYLGSKGREKSGRR